MSKFVPVPKPDPEIVALGDRLDAAIADCCARLRGDDGLLSIFMAHNEILAINADLDAVRRLNATLRHSRRSRAIENWRARSCPRGGCSGRAPS